MLKTINVFQFLLMLKEINYNMQKVLIGWSVIYENQHVSKVLHSPTTILLWLWPYQINYILEIYKKSRWIKCIEMKISSYKWIQIHLISKELLGCKGLQVVKKIGNSS
jgi:hypothetical protein